MYFETLDGHIWLYVDKYCHFLILVNIKFHRDLLNWWSLRYFVKDENKVSVTDSRIPYNAVRSVFRLLYSFFCKLDKAFPLLVWMLLYPVCTHEEWTLNRSLVILILWAWFLTVLRHSSKLKYFLISLLVYIPLEQSDIVASSF